MNITHVETWMQPFLMALCGVLSDYVTTILGLRMGFCEACPQYHPVWALLVFWGSITILTIALPRKKPWNLGAIGLSAASYLGAVNNILVILGLTSGIAI